MALVLHYSFVYIKSFKELFFKNTSLYSGGDCKGKNKYTSEPKLCRIFFKLSTSKRHTVVTGGTPTESECKSRDFTHNKQINAALFPKKIT